MSGSDPTARTSGEDAINAAADEALPAGADDTHDALDTVASLRDALEHEQRQGNHDASPMMITLTHARRLTLPAPPLGLSASALPKWSPGVGVEEGAY